MVSLTVCLSAYLLSTFANLHCLRSLFPDCALQPRGLSVRLVTTIFSRCTHRGLTPLFRLMHWLSKARHEAPTVLGHHSTYPAQLATSMGTQSRIRDYDSHCDSQWSFTVNDRRFGRRRRRRPGIHTWSQKAESRISTQFR